MRLIFPGDLIYFNFILKYLHFLPNTRMCLAFYEMTKELGS